MVQQPNEISSEESEQLLRLLRRVPETSRKYRDALKDLMAACDVISELQKQLKRSNADLEAARRQIGAMEKGMSALRATCLRQEEELRQQRMAPRQLPVREKQEHSSAELDWRRDQSADYDSSSQDETEKSSRLAGGLMSTMKERASRDRSRNLTGLGPLEGTEEDGPIRKGSFSERKRSACPRELIMRRKFSPNRKRRPAASVLPPSGGGVARQPRMGLGMSGVTGGAGLPRQPRKSRGRRSNSVTGLIRDRAASPTVRQSLADKIAEAPDSCRLVRTPFTKARNEFSDTLDGVDSLPSELSSVLVIEEDESVRGSESGEKQETPTKKTEERVLVFARAHCMVEETVKVRRELCDVCSKMVSQGSVMSRCSACRQVCHVDCVREVEMSVCAPRSPDLNRNLRDSPFTFAVWLPETFSPSIAAPLILCVNHLREWHADEHGLYTEQSGRSARQLESNGKSLLSLFCKQRTLPSLAGKPQVLTHCIRAFLAYANRQLLSGEPGREVCTACMQEKVQTDALQTAIDEMPAYYRDPLALLCYHWISLRDEDKLRLEDLAKFMGPTIVQSNLVVRTAEGKVRVDHCKVFAALLSLPQSFFEGYLVCNDKERRVRRSDIFTLEAMRSSTRRRKPTRMASIKAKLNIWRN